MSRSKCDRDKNSVVLKDSDKSLRSFFERKPITEAPQQKAPIQVLQTCASTRPSEGVSAVSNCNPIIIQQGIPVGKGSICAGPTCATLGKVIFSNSNGVSFGISGQTLTASFSGGGGGGGTGVAISASGSSQSSGTVIFSNAHGLSFGMNGATITGSYTVPTVTQSTQTQNCVDLSFGGNTSGALALISSGTALFFGGNNITLSQNGQSVTISGPTVSGGVPFGVSAGTQSVSTGTVSFADSNGVTFGMAGSSKITASVRTDYLSTQSNQALSAGNGSFTFQTATLADSNGVSFSTGTQGVYATVKTDYLTSQSNQAISAANGSFTFQTASFANSNGVSFSTGTQGVFATVKTDYLTSQSNQAASGSNGSFTFQTLSFGTENGISFYTSNSSLVASYTVPTVPPETPFGVSAGTQSVSTGTLVFSNSNNVTFGMSGSSRITASASFPSETPFGVSAGSQSVSTGTLVFSDSNGISFGMSGSSRVTASYTVPSTAGLISAINVSASGTSNNLTNVIFSNSNAFTFGMSGSTITASYTVPTVTNSSWTVSDAATSLTISRLAFTNSNGLTLSLSTGAGAATVIGSYTVPVETPFGVSAGSQSVSTGTLVFSNSNNVTFGMSGSSRVTASASFPAETPFGISAGTQSVSTGTVSFANSNGIAFGMSGSNTITASYTVPTVTNSSWTVSDAATSATVGRLAFTNSNGLTLSLSTSNNGNHTVIGSYTVPTVTNSSWTVSDAATSLTISRLAFTNSNGLTLSLSTGAGAATVIGSYTVPSVTNSSWTVSDANTSLTISRLAFTNSNGLTLSLSTGAGAATVIGSYTVPTQSNQTVGLYMSSNTTSSISSGTVDARSMTFRGVGLASVGYSGGEVVISVPAGAPSPVNFSAGAASANLGSVVFTNLNNVSFGLNGSSISASASFSQTVDTLGIYASSQTVGQSSSSTYDARSLSIVGDGIISVGWSNSSLRISATSNPGTLSFYQNIPSWVGMVTGGSAITVTSGSSIFIQPFVLPNFQSISYLRLLASLNDSAVGTGGTTSLNTSCSVERYTTIAAVIYSQGVGANSRSIQALFSSSVGITGRTIFSMGNGGGGSSYTITIQKTFPNTGTTDKQYTTSYNVNSASIVISSNSNTLFTGAQFIDIPFATSFTPGNYWLGIGASTSSTSNSSIVSFAGTNGMPISLAAVSQSNVSVGLMGQLTSASDYQLQPGLGLWTTNASVISKDSIGLNSISQLVSNREIPFQFIRGF